MRGEETQMKNFAAIALAGSALMADAQSTELNFYIYPTGNGNEWLMEAELDNPTGTVLATIADLGFTLTGTNISDFEYNSAFDSDFFGDADVTVTSEQIDFIGNNALPPLNNSGGTDSSNPLRIATFQADRVNSFDLVGQVTGAYTGIPFPEILFYQNADGTPGTTRWCYFFNCTPTPGTATALFMGCALVARRRR